MTYDLAHPACPPCLLGDHTSCADPSLTSETFETGADLVLVCCCVTDAEALAHEEGVRKEAVRG